MSYVVNKRSQMGRRFGFVRFINVCDDRDLEKCLCEMWFGNYDIFASVA